MAEILIGQVNGKGGGTVALDLSRANRHGLIAGATGTGKTVTLQSLAEQLAKAGCNVFVSDVKGDLSGIAMPGEGQSWISQKYQQLKQPYKPQACPVTFWDVNGKLGYPARATMSELGPLLLGRLLDLNDTQTGVLQIVFRVADDQPLPLLDLKDLRALLGYVGDNAKQISTQYGNVSPASLGTIQRALLTLEQDGDVSFFGEPALQVSDLLAKSGGQGMIHVLDATKLMQAPRIYATFLLYLMGELFEQLPEVGDLPVPKLCFFFDEAHLLFNEAPKPLLEKVVQVVRLIRSKGVGVYFVTQQPSDVPEDVLGQLGNRIQHALRAATPQGQKDIKVAATTMASNPDFDTAKVLPTLAVGEALVSVLDAKGIPTPVQRTFILPPESRVGPITTAERGQIMASGSLAGRYDQSIDRESAFEMLQGRLQQAQATGAQVNAGKGKASADDASAYGQAGQMAKDVLLGTGRRQGLLEAAAKTVVRQMAGQVGRSLLRGLLGGVRR